MIKNEVMHKIMKDMVMYLTPYQLKKLKTTLQDKLENVEINLILDKEKFPLPAKLPEGNFECPIVEKVGMFMSKKISSKNEMFLLRLSKEQKEKIFNIVEKSSYNSASELIRSGIEKEINLQMYKDNMDVIIKELSKLIDVKLDNFIKSERKLIANNVRVNALNTYIMGEVIKRLMGDELYQEFLKIIESGRVKANYFVSRNAEDISKEELLEFYGIGKVYRNE